MQYKKETKKKILGAGNQVRRQRELKALCSVAVPQGLTGSRAPTLKHRPQGVRGRAWDHSALPWVRLHTQNQSSDPGFWYAGHGALRSWCCPDHSTPWNTMLTLGRDVDLIRVQQSHVAHTTSWCSEDNEALLGCGAHIGFWSSHTHLSWCSLEAALLRDRDYPRVGSSSAPWVTLSSNWPSTCSQGPEYGPDYKEERLLWPLVSHKHATVPLRVKTRGPL